MSGLDDYDVSEIPENAYEVQEILLPEQISSNEGKLYF